MDADGISAEVIFPDADAVESRTCAPFGTGLGLSGDHDPELGLAGARAHNRWLAEMCADSPERRKGVALVQITAPLDDVLAEIRRAKESGLSVVMIPAMWMHQAPYHDRSYDPVWALCEELEMPVVHPLRSGGQGVLRRPPRDLHNRGRLVAGPPAVVHAVVRRLRALPRTAIRGDRGRMLVGARDCCGSGTASSWARRAQRSWRRSGSRRCRASSSTATASSGPRTPSAARSAMRYEIGIDNMLWGNDFPHPEGTWPNSRSGWQKTYHDVPIAETRRMIGEAAAETYGFDLAALEPTAERLAVTPRVTRPDRRRRGRSQPGRDTRQSAGTG